MKKIDHNFTTEQKEWYDLRPPNIKAMIDRIPPNSKWFLKETGKDYYEPYSYCEDGTITVIRYDYRTNQPIFKVFGIEPKDLLKEQTL